MNTQMRMPAGSRSPWLGCIRIMWFRSRCQGCGRVTWAKRCFTHSRASPTPSLSTLTRTHTLTPGAYLHAVSAHCGREAAPGGAIFFAPMLWWPGGGAPCTNKTQYRRETGDRENRRCRGKIQCRYTQPRGREEGHVCRPHGGSHSAGCRM